MDFYFSKWWEENLETKERISDLNEKIKKIKLEEKGLDLERCSFGLSENVRKTLSKNAGRTYINYQISIANLKGAKEKGIIKSYMLN